MFKGKNLLRLFLVFVPICIFLGSTDASPTWVFISCCLAVLPLAGLMGEGTENLVHHTGPGLGAVISSSCGNAAEMILAIMALRAGELEIVKASLTGSIIGNILVVLGMAMFLGGWKQKEMKFNRMAAESGSSMMFLAVVAFVIPALFAQVTEHKQADKVESISLEISVLLILMYIGSLIFTLKSHRHMFQPEGEDTAQELEHGAPWSVKKSLLVLIAAAIGVGVVAHFLVHAVEAAGQAMGMGKVFMGVVVLALIGNAAENSTAIVMAVKGKMDLALGIALGSSMQIAVFVAPVVVIVGWAIGKPIDLEFSLLEVMAVMLSVGAVTLLIHDGKTNWFEGLQLLAIYVILAIAFYYV